MREPKKKKYIVIGKNYTDHSWTMECWTNWAIIATFAIWWMWIRYDVVEMRKER